MADRSADWMGQAERDLEAALQRWGAEAWGHSCVQLLRTVDRYYVPARYPNGYAEGKPGDYITQGDADDAIGSGEAIVRFCNGLLA